MRAYEILNKEHVEVERVSYKEVGYRTETGNWGRIRKGIYFKDDSGKIYEYMTTASSGMPNVLYLDGYTNKESI